MNFEGPDLLYRKSFVNPHSGVFEETREPARPGRRLARRRAGCRNANGQAIILGTLVVMLLISIVVGACVMLFSTGMTEYYSVKFRRVAQCAARYAVNCKYWLGAERPNSAASNYGPPITEASIKTKTEEITREALLKMGVKAEQCTINVEPSGAGCKVDITITGLPLLQTGQLTGNINVRVQGYEKWTYGAPTGVMKIGFGNAAPASQQLDFPVYGAGAHTPGASSVPLMPFPYWENGTTNGMIPPITNPTTGP